MVGEESKKEEEKKVRKESTESRNLEVSVDLEQNIDHKNQAFMNK